MRAFAPAFVLLLAAIGWGQLTAAERRAAFETAAVRAEALRLR